MNTGIYTWFWVSGLKSLPNFLPMWPPGHTGQLVADFCRSPSLKLSFRSICRPPSTSVHCGQWLIFKFIRSSVGMTEVYGHPCPSLWKRAYHSCACWMGLLDTNGLKVSVYLKCPCSSSVLSAVPYRESVHGDHNFTVAVVLVGVTVAHFKPTQFCLQSTKAKVLRWYLILFIVMHCITAVYTQCQYTRDLKSRHHFSRISTLSQFLPPFTDRSLKNPLELMKILGGWKSNKGIPFW